MPDETRNCGPACDEAERRLQAFAEEIQALAVTRGIKEMVVLIGEKTDHGHFPSVIATNATIGAMMAFSKSLQDRVLSHMMIAIKDMVTPAPEPSAS